MLNFRISAREVVISVLKINAVTVDFYNLIVKEFPIAIFRGILAK